MALTGTDRGSGSTNTGSQSTLVVTPASNLAAGSLAVLCVAYDNSGTLGADPFASISDNSGAGNTWTSRQAPLNDPGAANAGHVLRIFTCRLKAALTTSQSITVDFGGVTTVARSWTLMEVTGAAGMGAIYQTGANGTGSSTTPSITSGSITNGDMIIAAMGAEGNAAITGDSDVSNGSWSTQQTSGVGTTNAASEISSQRKVVTGNGAQTYNLTITSADWCIAWIQLREVADTAPIPGTATLALTTFAPKLAGTVIPVTKSLSLSTFAPVTVLGRRVIPDNASLTVTTFAPKLAAAFILSAKSLTTVGFAPKLSSAIITPQTSLSTVKFAPRIGLGIIPATSSLTLTTLAPTLTTASIVKPDTATLSLTAFASRPTQTGDFPRTSVLDDFNRADEGPPPSANWTTGIAGELGGSYPGFGFAVISNQINHGGSDVSQQFWNDSLFGPDSEAYITVSDGFGLAAAGLAVRLTNIGESTTAGYLARVRVSGVDRTYFIYKVTDGGLTVLASSSESGAGSATGDRYGIRAVGDVLELWGDTGDGWEVKLSVSDSEYTSAGNLGVFAEGSSGSRLDDFGGGSLITAVTVTPDTKTLISTTFVPILKTSVIPSTSTLTVSRFAPVIAITVVPITAILVSARMVPVFALSAVPAVRSLSLTSFAVTLAAHTIPATATLHSATFAPSLAFTVTPGTRSLVSQSFALAVSISANIRVVPDTASLTTMGQSPVLAEAVRPTTRALVALGFTPTLDVSNDIRVTPATKALVVTQFAPVLAERLIPGARALNLSTFESTLTANVTVSPATATLTASTFAPTIVTPVTLVPGTPSITLLTFVPRLKLELIPITRAVTVTSFVPQLRLTVIPSTRTLSTTQFAPLLRATVTVATKSLSVNTLAPTISITDQHTVIPAAKTLIITRFAPIVLASVSVSPSTASLTITTAPPRLVSAVIPAFSALTLNGYSPSVEFDVDVVPSTITLIVTTFAPVAAGGIVVGSIASRKQIKVSSESRIANVAAEPGLIKVPSETRVKHVF